MAEAVPAMISGQPVLILREGTTRSRGREAQRANITAAKVVAETVKSSLGPKGMDKMLVDGLGDVTITSDGATVLWNNLGGRLRGGPPGTGGGSDR